MIIDALARLAAEEPRRAALASVQGTWNYAELWRGLNVMESRLKAATIPRGARVGVSVAELKLSWLSILALEKMGHAACAMPQGVQPSDLGLVNVGAVLTDGRWPLNTHTPIVDVTGGRAFAPAPGLSVANDRPERECFILLSSGTTGHFKKVQFSGALRDARLSMIVAQRGYGPATRHFIGNLGPWTAHGYTAPLAVWLRGGLVLVDQSDAPVDALATLKPNSVFTTPGIAATWVHGLGDRQIDLGPCRISLGGGPLSPQLFGALRKHFPDAVIQHVYAMTEAGSVTTTIVRSPEDLESHVPDADMRIEVVDTAGAVVPSGTIGAIRVRSPSLARGYLDDAVASATFFRDGWFYPGDLGYLRPDGRLVLTGRFTEIINYRGDKLAPSHFEEPIRRALDVVEVAVVGRPVPGRLDALHVFVATQEPLARTRVESALEQYSSGFSKIDLHVVQALPRNTMGKILYGQLRGMIKS